MKTKGIGDQGSGISGLRPLMGDRGLIRRFAGPALILLAAALAVAPMILRGPSCGHDFDFHLSSWFDALHSWRNGLVYPHWAPSANYGAGEPRFVFYPPLTWMLGALLGSVMPWQFVPAALIFLLLAGTGLATRALAREALDEGAATLAGCFALFSGYALFTAYERSAFGELTGGIWIPLLLLFILRSRVDSGPVWRQALDGSILPLALVVAGCWFSNAPLGLMACFLLPAVALASAVSARNWAPVLRASAAMVAGLAIAGLYLLPAACEQRWVDIRQAIGDPGQRIESSFLFARHADPALASHDSVLHRASLIAVFMLAVAFSGLLIALLPKSRRSRIWSQRRWWIPLALIPPAVLFLMLPVSLPVWNLLPRLRFLQFPWRWLVVLEAPMAIFMATALWPLRRWARWIVAAGCAGFFLATVAHVAHNNYQVCDEEDAVAGMVSAYKSGSGFEGTDEYAPPGADNELVPPGLPAACLVTDPLTALGLSPGGQAEAPLEWKEDQHSCDATPPWQLDQPEHKRLTGTLPHAGFLILRLRSYPAWRVRLNGQTISSLPRRDDGLMAVPVPQGPVELTVDWTTTPDVIAGRWLSALGVLLLAMLWLLERRLNRPRL